MGNIKVRESSFELIRLLAMLMIVIYHQYCHHIQLSFETSFNKAIWIPLHIGVPLFLLISGYWGIRVSGKSLFRLLGQMFIYGVSLLLIYNYLEGIGGGKATLKTLFFVSNSPYWFMRTYLYLFLFSPVINKYLDGITLRNRICLLLALGFIALYVGTLGWDLSLRDGKNLICFIFVYVIGDTLRVYEKEWRKIHIGYLISIYVAMNLIVFVCYYIFYDAFIGKLIWRLFFPYQSPGLIVNGVFFFLIVLHWQFKSKAVNWLASSALAIYLIHESRLVETYVLGPVSLSIRDYMGSDLMTLPVIVILALIVCIVCILVDKLLKPLWRWFVCIGECLERGINASFNYYINKRK